MEEKKEFVGALHIPKAHLKVTWKDFLKMLLGYRPHFSCCVEIIVEYYKDVDDLRISNGGYSTNCIMAKPGDTSLDTSPAKVGFEKLHETRGDT